MFSTKNISRIFISRNFKMVGKTLKWGVEGWGNDYYFLNAKTIAHNTHKAEFLETVKLHLKPFLTILLFQTSINEFKNSYTCLIIFSHLQMYFKNCFCRQNISRSFLFDRVCTILHIPFFFFFK